VVDGSLLVAPSAIAVDGWGNLFIADGKNLDEVTPTDANNLITSPYSNRAPSQGWLWILPGRICGTVGRSAVGSQRGQRSQPRRRHQHQ